jgi:hypothetical protein
VIDPSARGASALAIDADLQVTDAAAAESLSLPIYAGLTPDEQRRVVDAVRLAVGRHAHESVRATRRAPLRTAPGTR